MKTPQDCFYSVDKSIWFGVPSGLHSGKKSLPFFREVFKEGKKSGKINEKEVDEGCEIT